MSAASCARKVPWQTQALAEGHRLLVLAGGRNVIPERLHTYRCPECALWHVGHSTPTRVDYKALYVPSLAPDDRPRRRC